MTVSSLVLPTAEAAAINPLAYASFVTQGFWRPYRIHRFVGRQLERLVRGEILRLVISLPPGSGKSMLLSRFFAAWWLGTHPGDKVVNVGLSDDAARDWGRQARDDFFLHGEKLWGLTTWSKSNVGRWDVYKNGRRNGSSFRSIGMGGAIMGKRANLLCIDDTFRSLAQARNPKLTEAQYEWLQGTCFTRLEPGIDGLDARVVILMTRFTEYDLIGRLMTAQGKGALGTHWEFVNVPAIAEENDPMGRAPGEPHWPEKYPLALLESRKLDVGPLVWPALYQGRPAPREGTIFKREWFRRWRNANGVAVVDAGALEVDKLPKFATVDLAGSKKKRADFTVIAVWAFAAPGTLLLVDLVRKRFEGHEVIPAFKRVLSAHPTLSVIYAEREGPWLEAKLGSVLKEALRQGVPIVETDPCGDKESRAIAATGALAAGIVWFPEDGTPVGGKVWHADYEAELLSFPNGDLHDDQVDATTSGIAIFNEMVAAYRPRAREEGPGWGTGELRGRGQWD